jgi:amphi-Trp domain-containing protein
VAGQQVKVSMTAGLGEIVDRLEQLVQALKKGCFRLSTEGEAITLKPRDPVMLAIDAEALLEKDGLREQLIIELKWQQGAEPPAPSGALSITHHEPIFES